MKKQMFVTVLLVTLASMATACAPAKQGEKDVIGMPDAPVNTPAGDAEAKQDAATKLVGVLGSNAQGKALMSNGVKSIQGEPCESFSVGVNTPERFVKEAHYAVCPKAGIFIMDIIAAEWKPFAPAQ